MARAQELLKVPYRSYIELTNADVSAITFQVKEGAVDILRAAALPAGTESGWEYKEGEGERNASLSDISSAVGQRVFAKSLVFPHSFVLVDHA
jgi:hypothetical protein